MFRFTLTFAILFATALTVRAEQSTDQSPAVNFTDHVMPIFRQHCLKCHNANDAEAGLAIDSYGGLMEGGGSGDVVSPGDPSTSRLYLVMSHVEEPTMPPNQEALPAESLEVIRKWIEGGLLENSGSKAKKRKGPSLSFSTSSDGKPDEIAMPESVWRVPVVTSERAAAATALAASPWAPLVAVAGQRQVSLYHTDTNDLVGIIPYPEGVPQVLHFSRDGAYLLVAGGTHASKGTASLYGIRDGQRMLTVGDELDTVLGADINDQLSRIALGGPQKIVRIFDTASGEVLFELKKHTDWVFCVDYSPDGVLVASGDRSGGLHVWEADTGRLYLDLVGHQGAIQGLAWRPDSNVLVSASDDGTIKMWEMNGGNQLKSFNAHGGGATGVVMAKDGRIATSGKDKTIKLWNADGSAVATMPAFSEPALEVALTHDATKLVGGDWNGRTLMWQISDPKQFAELVANPPRLEDQETALAAEVDDLQALVATANAELAAQQLGVETSRGTEEAVVAELARTKTMLETDNTEKSAAESLLADLKKQKAQHDETIKGLKSRTAELEQTSKQAAIGLESAQGRLKEAEARLGQAMKVNDSLSTSLTSLRTEHDQLKSQIVSTFSQLTERELVALADEQVATTHLESAERTRQQAEDSLAEANAKIETLADESKSAGQQLKQAATELEAAGQAVASATKQAELSRAEFDSKSAILVSLQQQLAEAQDENQRNSLSEKVASLQLEIDGTSQSLQAAEALLGEAKGNFAAQEKMLQECNQRIASATEQTKDLALRRDELIHSMPALSEDRDRLAKAREAKTLHLASLRKEFEAAQGDKQNAVNRLADISSQQLQLTARQQRLADVLAREQSATSAARAEVVEAEKGLAESNAAIASVRVEMDAVASQLVDVTSRLTAQPAVVEEIASRVKSHSDAIPKLEKRLADAKQKSEESMTAAAKSKEAVDAAAARLEQAKTRWQGIQTELVAFKSQADTLQAAYAAAESIALDKQGMLKPDQEAVIQLEESIKAREQKLAETNELLAKLRAELESLEAAQGSDQASLTETRSRFEALEAAAEEAAAEAEATREKYEFFKSAYGG